MEVTPVSEAGLQKAVLELAKANGWDLRYHERRGGAHWSLGSGLPDLILVRAPRMVMAELKTETGQLGPKQVQWLDALNEVSRVHGSPEVYVWRPSDLRDGTIASLLR